MTDGFLDIDSTGVSGHTDPGLKDSSDHDDGLSANRFRTAVGWLPIALIAMAAAWLLIGRPWEATNRPIRLGQAAVQAKPASTVGLAREPAQPPFDPMTSEAIVPEQPAPVDRLTISSQSWRRGGLGSNAFVTMTLRNENSYAVKNVDIACAFSRPDGSHLTDRSRVIPDIVNMKSRKTFVRLHIGFINVNAAKAKCAPIGASHV
jgi:hypothetical protein